MFPFILSFTTRTPLTQMYIKGIASDENYDKVDAIPSPRNAESMFSFGQAWSFEELIRIGRV